MKNPGSKIKSRNQGYSGSVISWKDRNKIIIIKKGKRKSGQEKSTGYIASMIMTILPTVIVGSLLMGVCSYRAKAQRARIAEFGELEIEDKSKTQVVSSRLGNDMNREDLMMPGKYPKGKPKLEVVEDIKLELDEFKKEIENKKIIVDQLVEIVYLGQARYSYYWPPYGGINCEEPCEIMANGEFWKDNLGVTVACPVEWEIGSRVVLPIGEFICKDRGEMIIFIDGIPWIDHLSAVPIFDYGSMIDIEVYKALSPTTD